MQRKLIELIGGPMDGLEVDITGIHLKSTDVAEYAVKKHKIYKAKIAYPKEGWSKLYYVERDISDGEKETEAP